MNPTMAEVREALSALLDVSMSMPNGWHICRWCGMTHSHAPDCEWVRHSQATGEAKAAGRLILARLDGMTILPTAKVERLRWAVNYALNQWAAYADVDRGPDREWAYIAESADSGDAEADMFRQCVAALDAPKDPA